VIALWLLHKDESIGVGQGVSSLAPKIIFKENSSVEQQANILANFLLMPANQVKHAFYDIVKSTHDPAAALAEIFEVPEQVMSTFLHEQCLI